MEIETTTVKEKIRNYIVQTSHADANKIKDESLIFKEGFFDSMGFIMLIGALAVGYFFATETVKRFYQKHFSRMSPGETALESAR